ncbi:MAG: PGF-pre-PGF domain-containing protein [Candidatus Nanohaloarchaea archaeon]
MSKNEGYRKDIVLKLLLATALILAPSLAAAQPAPPQNVYGNVTFENSQDPVADANVTVVDENGNVDGYGLTDSDGYYDFNFYGSGTYYVFVEGWNSSKTLEYTSGGSEEINISNYPSPGPPSVSTGSASNIGMESATLEGSVSYNGIEDSVDVRFQYNDSLQNETVWKTVSSTSFSQDLIGLEPNTSYDYRAQLKYSGTVYNGSVKSFTTDANTTDTGGTGGNETDNTDSTDGTTSTGGGFTGGFTGGTEEEPSTRFVNVSVADGSFSKDVGSLQEGQKVIIDFENAEVVERIEFNSLEDVNDTRLEYSYLGLNRPQGVEEPSSLVYSYEGVSFTGLDDSQVVNATIEFRVSKQWFERSRAKVEETSLQRYRGSWESYTTRKTGETSSSYEFSARTPGFSYFAVTSGNVRSEPRINVKNLKLEGGKTAPASLNATVFLENVGTASGSHRVSLRLDGEVYGQKTVEVGPGKVETVRFQLELEGGKHSIRTGSVEKNVMIREPEKGGGIPWVAVILIVFIAGAAAAAYYYYSSVHSPGMEDAVDMTRVSSIADLKKNEDMYLDEEIKLSGVKVDPIEKTEDGWRYIITDNTGKLQGLSPQKTQGRGSIGGPVKKENGELYIVF